jgi:phosphoglycolate phosphatase-like HAD superfamily hydrolase
MTTQDAQAELKNFKPKHGFFVGIDSDGCAFDTMELKHKECFVPNIIRCWDLQPVSKYARSAAEFVNLYSKWRGINRFPALVMVFDLLKDWEEVQRRGAAIPEATEVREFIASGVPMGNPALAKLAQETGNAVLKKTLEWSKAVNASVAEMVHGVPPFPFVRESLGKLSKFADIICVSATPGEALRREWEEHEIARFAAVIAGQEMGSKSKHLGLAAEGKYPPEKILMIGDAPGDMEAARANGALFYPINPGCEDASWEFFHNEAIEVFKSGNYAGSYEEKLIRQFQALLPSTPPWKK